MIGCELLTKLQNKLDDSLLQYKKDFEEYRQRLKNEFQTEWSKKKFKWFFKKYRQRKLKTKIYRRHCRPIFGLMEDILEETLPKTIELSFDQLTDIKNVALGDKNYFEYEELIDKINSFGCTSFNVTEEDIKRLNTPTLDPSHPCYGCCHYEVCGYFDFYDYEKTEEWNMAENCAGCCCGDGWECNKHNNDGCLNYEIEPILG